ncbi:NUDIX hydrolase [Serinibacter arcticus]|uniref:NUDIX hydrolase n=1 Tax=Serinibacter arcticus TaxID=1655435 RepID=A0A2U1ZS60_9MICO|nr:NUDIX domain-containing protein [Serinibacter arcticus]PWD49773.1 NUDIX hydrolase [Serinibacter arcticus]
MTDQGETAQPGEGWRIGEDGLPFRHAARVLLLDAEDRVLLVRAHDADQPDRTWWFTVGGGIDDGETPARAAAREVLEETGLVVDPDTLIGPVARRSAVFDFFARDVRQHEVFYVHRLTAAAPEAGELSTAGWTAVERSFVDELGWWSVADLRTLGVEVFPSELPDLVSEVLARLPVDGGAWPGPVRDLGDLDPRGAASERDGEPDAAP